MTRENKQPLISVIVPVYNVKEYVAKCLDSICGQTYRNLEIIVVDDGSTDGSGDICDAYAAKDSRIKTLHCENGGQSAARNRGLDIATGEYIAFVDSDDWIEKEMYERLQSAAEQHGADIAMCSYSKDYPNRSKVMRDSDKTCLWSGKEAVGKLFARKRMRDYVWDKIYRRHILDGIRFPEGKLYEDVATTYKLLMKAKMVFFMEKPYYHYLQRQGSTVNPKQYDVENHFCYFKVLLERSRFLSTYDKALWQKSFNSVANKGMQLIDRSYLDVENGDANERVRDYCRAELARLDRRSLRADLRVKTWLAVEKPRLYEALYRGFRAVFKSKQNFKKRRE